MVLFFSLFVLENEKSTTTSGKLFFSKKKGKQFGLLFS
jgi:hypothetical protein